MPSPADRLRSGEESRAAVGSFAALRTVVPNVPSAQVSGSYLPPPTHTFTPDELHSGDTFYGPGGAYVYTFPFIDSSLGGGTYSFPVPAEATRWGRAQHFWLFRDNAIPTPELDPYFPTEPFDAHSYWTAAGDAAVAGSYVDSVHDWGFGASYAVYIVVEVDDDHPAPEDPTIDLSDLIAFLQTLIAPPFVLDLRPTGMSDFEAEMGNRYFLDAAGAAMTLKGYQITDPAQITVDGTPATDVVIHSYERDADNNGFAQEPGVVTFTAPPHDPAPDDDSPWVAVEVTCANGVASGTVQYVDPGLFTTVTAITPNHLDDVTAEATITLSGVNFEENGFWVAFSPEGQNPPGPGPAPIAFGNLAFTSSFTATEVVLPYPFTDGAGTTYTLDPGTTYHVYVAGHYYRFGPTPVDLSTGGTAPG